MYRKPIRTGIMTILLSIMLMIVLSACDDRTAGSAGQNTDGNRESAASAAQNTKGSSESADSDVKNTSEAGCTTDTGVLHAESVEPGTRDPGSQLQEQTEDAEEKGDIQTGQYDMIRNPNVTACLQELDRQNVLYPQKDLKESETQYAEEQAYEIRELGGYKLPENSRQDLKNMLDSVYAPGYTMGFVMMDLGTGQGICFNKDNKYYSASSTKSSFVVSLAKERPDVVDSRRQYLVQITTNSDNDSYFMLEYDYGQEIHRDYAKTAGVDLELEEGGFAEVSAEDLTRLWLLNYDYFCSDERGDLVGSWFETPTYSAICASLGEDYVTRTKPGWIGGMLHNSSIDAGIVYAEEHPYVMTVMSDFPSNLEDLQETVLLLDRIHGSMFGESE